MIKLRRFYESVQTNLIKKEFIVMLCFDCSNTLSSWLVRWSSWSLHCHRSPRSPAVCSLSFPSKYLSVNQLEQSKISNNGGWNLGNENVEHRDWFNIWPERQQTFEVKERVELNACDNAIAEKERDGRLRKDDKRKLPFFPTLGPLVKIKTESTGKFSNFNFQWTKTLYQNNLKNIAFFFYIFQGLKM